MSSSNIEFIYQNRIFEIKNPDSNETLLNYIRTKLKKTGTKEGCAEGGCGACTVVLGELKNNEINYKAINSCITFLPTLQGKQLIIVEDLISKEGRLHPVQQAMVNYHGSQCGFCTPGFIMSLFLMFKSNSKFRDTEINDSIAGNLSLMLDILETGAYIEFDLLGRSAVHLAMTRPISDNSFEMPLDYLSYSSTALVAYAIPNLIKAGFVDKILLSQDVWTKIQLKHYGGTGYSFILETFLPHLRRLEVSEDDINKIIVENPKRILSLVEPK